jgi:caffeoyl-CoA O-methyltransferase
MPGILEKPVEDYINSLLPPRDAVLREMERYAASHDVPIVGPACGRVLFQLARSVRARRIFEMGSAIGYSTLWLARAVGPGGTVFYTDSDSANAARAKKYLGRAGVLGRVRLRVGDALDLLKTTRGTFYLVFNDVDKTLYPDALKLALPRIRPGGIFVTDNVLWSGRVARKSQRDAATQAIIQFNRLLYQSSGFVTTILPLRDGLAVALKSQ